MIELQADMSITEDLSAELGDNLRLNSQLNDVFVAGVTSWNGQTGDVTYTPPTVPTKTSELTNDSGFVTSADVPSKTSDLINDSGFLSSAVTSFNGQTGAALSLALWKPVYVVCTPQADGSAIIDSTTPYVQALPTTEDGKIYIYLGIAVSATTVELEMNHPVYYYKNNAIRIRTNS